MNTISPDGAGRSAAAETTSMEKDDRGWPILHSAEPCDGINPTTGQACLLGYHKGYHRDSAGAQWLADE